MSSKPSQAGASVGKSSVKTGAQIIVDTLIEQGVDTLFGYLGGHDLDTNEVEFL